MSSLIGITTRNLVKCRAFNKRLVSNLVFKKSIQNSKSQSSLYNRQLEQVKQQRLFSRNDNSVKNEENNNCKKLVCNTKKIKFEKEIIPKDESKLIGGSKKCLFNDPECCREKCPDANIKLDCLHYKMNDNKIQNYQKTWIDCPTIQIIPKQTCNQFIEPQLNLPIRSKKKDVVLKTAYSMASADAQKSLMNCKKRVKNTACIKLKMPGCKSASDPPKCVSDRKPKNVKKINCPYPAYSECEKSKIELKNLGECECLKVRTMCDIYAIAKKKRLRVSA